MMKKTLLVGSFGANNLGDELILLVALKKYPDSVVMTSNSKFSRNFTDTEFEVMSFPPTGFRSILKFIFSRKYRKNLCKFKTKIDRVVFAGGGLFSIKFRAYFLWWLVFIWLKLILKKTVEFKFEYQGIDESRNFLEKFILKYVFTRVHFISVRDKESKQALKSVLNVKQFKNVQVLDDRVYEWLKTIDCDSEIKSFEDEFVDKTEDCNFKIKSKSRDILLLNARNYIDKIKYYKIINKYANLEIVWILFEKNDRKFVPNDFTGVIIFAKNYKELFCLFNKAKICIGERFHFLVLAKIFVNKNIFLWKPPYAKKVDSFVRLNNIEEIEVLNFKN